MAGNSLKQCSLWWKLDCLQLLSVLPGSDCPARHCMCGGQTTQHLCSHGKFAGCLWHPGQGRMRGSIEGSCRGRRAKNTGVPQMSPVYYSSLQHGYPLVCQTRATWDLGRLGQDDLQDTLGGECWSRWEYARWAGLSRGVYAGAKSLHVCNGTVIIWVFTDASHPVEFSDNLTLITFSAVCFSQSSFYEWMQSWIPTQPSPAPELL